MQNYQYMLAKLSSTTLDYSQLNDTIDISSYGTSSHSNSSNFTCSSLFSKQHSETQATAADDDLRNEQIYQKYCHLMSDLFEKSDSPQGQTKQTYSSSNRHICTVLKQSRDHIDFSICEEEIGAIESEDEIIYDNEDQTGPR